MQRLVLQVMERAMRDYIQAHGLDVVALRERGMKILETKGGPLDLSTR